MRWPPRDLFHLSRNCPYCKFSLSSVILSYVGLGEVLGLTWELVNLDAAQLLRNVRPPARAPAPGPRLGPPVQPRQPRHTPGDRLMAVARQAAGPFGR